ncbi:hypothetical protein [Phenylobacterium sp.]|jgi:hypothetical protein|uniref:hypothetical protein n=1 Tax=Phenylobacterium sp. TaxID=1871053 RepID=UPI002F93D7EA
MAGSTSPPGAQRTCTIFMPLAASPSRGPAAEDKDYRPVEAEWLAGDVYRVVSAQPENEAWEYPSGATVFAVKLHAGDAVVVIVSAVSASRPVNEPDPRDARPERSQSGRGALRELREQKPRARVRPERLIRRIEGSRFALILTMMMLMAAAAAAWLRRDLDTPLQPADPIRASVVASCLILIARLCVVRAPHEVRALRTPSAIAGAAFVLSLLVGRCQV